MTAAPPSDVTFPPVVAPFAVIDVTAVVVTEGIKTGLLTDKELTDETRSEQPVLATRTRY